MSGNYVCHALLWFSTFDLAALDVCGLTDHCRVLPVEVLRDEAVLDTILAPVGVT